jgi:hypothetical protein
MTYLESKQGCQNKNYSIFGLIIHLIYICWIFSGNLGQG